MYNGVYNNGEAGKLSQWLRVLVAHMEDKGSVHSTHTHAEQLTTDYIFSSRESDTPPLDSMAIHIHKHISPHRKKNGYNLKLINKLILKKVWELGGETAEFKWF